jgi:hypothetical protein
MAKNHYINNKDFLNEMTKYRASIQEAKRLGSLPKPQIPRYVAECFMKIAENLSHKPNFLSYTFRDEMVADAIENCVMYVDNFDPAKSSNPFAYFTQITYYAFLRRIQKEKKQLYVKYKATQQFGILDQGEMYEDVDGNMKQFELYDNISEFIETFEKNRDNKKKIKVKGLEKFISYAEELKGILDEAGITGTIDNRDEKIGRKIRDSEVRKVPFMLIVGEKEQEEGKVAVRKHGQGDLGVFSSEEFIQYFKGIISESLAKE